jgi:hypothetical protein
MIQNPDGGVSNAMTFTLSLTYSLRMKAWRVFPGAVIAGGGGGGSFGTDRDVSEVRDILVNDENSPTAVWSQHGINFTLTSVSDVVFPAPWGDDSVPEGADPVPIALANPASDGSPTFDPGAINVYFVEDIQGPTTINGYAVHPIDPTTALATAPCVVFSDSKTLTTAKCATVASHEVGHLLSLHHVCARESTSEDPQTLFGRVCGPEATDRNYLMYPELDWTTHTGTTITSQQATFARRAAAKLHGR